MAEAACELCSGIQEGVLEQTGHSVQRTTCLLRAGPGSGQGLGMEGLDPSTIPGSDSASPSFAAGRLWRVPDSAERLLSIPLRISAFIPAALLPGSPAERKCPWSRTVTIALSGPCVAKPQSCRTAMGKSLGLDCQPPSDLSYSPLSWDRDSGLLHP